MEKDERRATDELVLEPAVGDPKTSSLFPVLLQPSTSEPNSSSATAAARWLSNTSFTTDLSVINDAVSTRHNHSATTFLESHSDDEDEREPQVQRRPPSYELVESSASDCSSSSDDDGQRIRRTRRKRNKKNKKRKRSGEAYLPYDYAPASRKPDVRSWGSPSASTTTAKDYYFDSRGDRDNLAFGCLYKMDVARYKPYSSFKSSEWKNRILYPQNQRNSVFDRDGDIDSLDVKLKSGGRYWSAKHAALERHKNIKRIRIVVLEKSMRSIPADFIPLSEEGSDVGLLSGASVVQESWDDEVLRKTKEFNRMTRERPHDEKVWLAFAKFQDKIASMQPQKGARLQTLEKKISILEKANELNPDAEELLLALMSAYQRRDSSDVLIGRWEKMLLHHSGSYKLWREFLHVIQGEFSRFKVSEMRKMYANAIQALYAACSKQYRQHRQVHHAGGSPLADPAIVQQELCLVDIFLSLCRFEWQAGYQELATALFQAEIEYSLFCPSLLLTEQSKHRLFEHFWNSDCARVGEDGALGWSTWLEEEEEQRQKSIMEESSLEVEEGGWTGWSEPLSKNKELIKNPESIRNDVDVEEFDAELDDKDNEQQDDTEELLKIVGIDADAEADDEMKDAKTWARWSKEELSRDFDQWMPSRAESGRSFHRDGTADGEGDDQLLRVILYEDVSEYLFTISSEEARLSLVSQFIDFYGGRIAHWTCTNSSSWAEKNLSLETLPEFISDDLIRVHRGLTVCNLNLGTLLSNSSDTSMKTNMMKFVRNATLLFLRAFPHNYNLEESALVAEELAITRMNSSSFVVTPCRNLAKNLLKSNRQDVLLCGVYAQREAVYGNIDHARKIFDMALLSVEGLPSDSRTKASLLYFWYAEMELANSSGIGSESRMRAIHILSCMGSGIKYCPFKSQPSSLQQLRARQGFKELIRILQSTWSRGETDDHSVALFSSAALFEELTAGWAAGIEVLDQAFSMVLPERRRQSHQLEVLYDFYIRMIWRHHAQLRLLKVWESIVLGLQIYPFSPKLYDALVEISHLHTVPNKVRWIFDDYCQKQPSVNVWLSALSFEMSKGGSYHRVRGLFERALVNDKLRRSVILWRCYIAYEIDVARNPSAAKRIFFRAIHACPWSKKLWLDGFIKLNSVLTAKELADLQEVMRDKELNLRTDIYEILLLDEME